MGLKKRNRWTVINLNIKALKLLLDVYERRKTYKALKKYEYNCPLCEHFWGEPCLDCVWIDTKFKDRNNNTIDQNRACIQWVDMRSQDWFRPLKKHEPGFEAVIKQRIKLLYKQIAKLEAERAEWIARKESKTKKEGKT